MGTSLFEGCISATVGRASLWARLAAWSRFLKSLTSGPLTLYSPNLIMTRTRWSVLEARRASASGSGFDFRAQFSTVRQLCDLG